MAILTQVANAIRNDPIAIVPIEVTALLVALNKELLGPALSF